MTSVQCCTTPMQFRITPMQFRTTPMHMGRTPEKEEINVFFSSVLSTGSASQECFCYFSGKSFFHFQPCMTYYSNSYDILCFKYQKTRALMAKTHFWDAEPVEGTPENKKNKCFPFPVFSLPALHSRNTLVAFLENLFSISKACTNLYSNSGDILYFGYW